MEKLYMQNTFETSELEFLAMLPAKLEHEFLRYLARHPDVREGRACIKGTNTTVTSIGAQLLEGVSVSKLLNAHPKLTADMLQACRDFLNVRNYYNPSIPDQHPADVAVKLMVDDVAAVAISHRDEKVKPRPWQIVRIFDDTKSATEFCERMFPQNKYSWSQYMNTPQLKNWGEQFHLVAKNPYSIDGYTMDSGHGGLRMWEIRENAKNRGYDSFVITNTEWSDCDAHNETTPATTVVGVFHLHQIIEARDGWSMADPSDSSKIATGLYLFAQRLSS